jgi:hypothetical protein
MKPLIRRPMSSMSSSSQFLAFFVCVALLGGCASPATYEGMVPTAFDVPRKHTQTVSVAVSGGKETESTGKSQISDAAFTQAFVDSITKSQTFSRVVQGKGADYLLTVLIVSVEQPSFGFSFTVKIEAGWILKRADTGATVWQGSVISQYTATTSDAFAAVERLRLATEGAARNNIADGLARISKLDF